jgi:PiT family inorganic phosphate transporter
VASSILFIFGIAIGAPISTTHTITSAIMGVGATKRLSAVRWGVAGNIVLAWILTFPAAGAIACVAYFAVRPLFN